MSHTTVFVASAGGLAGEDGGAWRGLAWSGLTLRGGDFLSFVGDEVVETSVVVLRLVDSLAEVVEVFVTVGDETSVFSSALICASFSDSRGSASWVKSVLYSVVRVSLDSVVADFVGELFRLEVFIVCEGSTVF